jgi:hypothetical protein
MREDTIEHLRREVSKLRVGRGQRFPKALRARLIAWAKQERARSNASWSMLGEMVAVHGETLRAWCIESKPRAHRMRSVEIVADSTRAPDDSRSEESRMMSVVSPSGFRVEGISLRDAISILQALR